MRVLDLFSGIGGFSPGLERAGMETVAEWEGGSLNPQWVEWLMGFPEGWTDLSNSETQ